MKKLFGCLVVYLFFTGSVAAQIFNIGVHVAATGSSVSWFSTNIFGKVGYSTGIILTEAADDDWNFYQLEINYTQKGGFHKPSDTTGLDLGLLQLNYLEFPVLYRYDDLWLPRGNRGYLEFGASYGHLLRSHLYYNYNSQDLPSGFVRKYDVSLLLGFGVHAGDHFLFRFRYSCSLHGVLMRDPIPAPYRNFRSGRGLSSQIQFGLAYMIGME